MQMQTEGVTAVHCNAQNVRPHAAILHVRGLDDITGSRVQRQAGAAAFAALSCTRRLDRQNEHFRDNTKGLDPPVNHGTFLFLFPHPKTGRDGNHDRLPGNTIERQILRKGRPVGISPVGVALHPEP